MSTPTNLIFGPELLYSEHAAKVLHNESFQDNDEAGYYETFSSCSTSPDPPIIRVIKKYPDWSVIKVSRGIEQDSLLEWVSENANICFEAPSPRVCSYFCGSENGQKETEETRLFFGVTCSSDITPAFASPHDSAYAFNLVLIARNTFVLEQLIYLKVTVHCLVKGHHKPFNQIHFSSRVDDKECATRAACLEVRPSNSIGHISLLAIYNDRRNGAWIAQNQFRHHLSSAGWPVLGIGEEAWEFKGEPLCMSTVRLEFLALGIEKQLCVSIPPTPDFRSLLDREERLCRIRLGQEDIRVELFAGEIPKPPEYMLERTMFDGLEFRITPVAMIPRQKSIALVDLAVEYYENKISPSGQRPSLFDVGTGCGNLLVSILTRLGHRNAVGLGLDAFKETLELADYNIASHGVCRSARTIQGKFKDIQHLRNERFNLVVCNPPYYKRGSVEGMDIVKATHEPSKALLVDDEEDDMIHYMNVLSGLVRGRLLLPGAFLVFETCQENSERVANLMTNCGFENVQIIASPSTHGEPSTRTVEGVFSRDEQQGILASFW